MRFYIDQMEKPIATIPYEQLSRENNICRKINLQPPVFAELELMQEAC